MRNHLCGYTCLIVLSMMWRQNLSSKPKLKYLHFGGIFDHGDVESKAGFLFGVSQYNNKQWKLFKLSSLVEVIDVKNSFKLASSICSHMSEGVFLIFGARPSESANIVQSYTKTFHIPYVSPTAADTDPNPDSAFQIHMKPSHTKALVGIIQHYLWRTFHYVYDSEEVYDTSCLVSYHWKRLEKTFQMKCHMTGLSEKLKEIPVIRDKHLKYYRKMFDETVLWCR